MKIRGLLALLLMQFLFVGALGQAAALTNQTMPQPILEIKDGWYYLNGQKFFVNAIGYEIGARPGQHPYIKRASEPERVKRDMAVIKEGGFNAIRTWSELSEEELKVVQASGLKVIFGIGIAPASDFGDPAVVKGHMSIVNKVLAYSKHYDSIITYLIMNEPMPQHIQKSGCAGNGRFVDGYTRFDTPRTSRYPGNHYR